MERQIHPDHNPSQDSTKNERDISLEKAPIETKIESINSSEIDQFMLIAHEAVMDEPLPKEYEKTRETSMSERTKDFYEIAFANPQEWTLLAAKNSEGKMIGVLEARIIDADDGKVGLVYVVGVHRDERRQGIAMNLYFVYESILKNRGDVAYLMSGTFITNAPSMGLHEKFGMTIAPVKLESDKMKVYRKTL